VRSTIQTVYFKQHTYKHVNVTGCRTYDVDECT